MDILYIYYIALTWKAHQCLRFEKQ